MDDWRPNYELRITNYGLWRWPASGGFEGREPGIGFSAGAVLAGCLGVLGLSDGGGAGDADLLGLGAPLVAAVVWGIFVAPKAVVKRRPLALILKLVLFGLAVVALGVAGQPALAGVFAVATVINLLLLEVLGR